MKNWMITNMKDEVRKDIKSMAVEYECTIPQMLEILVDWYYEDRGQPSPEKWKEIREMKHLKEEAGKLWSAGYKGDRVPGDMTEEEIAECRKEILSDYE